MLALVNYFVLIYRPIREVKRENYTMKGFGLVVGGWQCILFLAPATHSSLKN